MLTLCPLVNHLTQFNITITCMMHLVNIDTERRDTFDNLTQFIREFHFLPLFSRIKVTVAPLFFIPFLKNNLLSISHCHQSPKIRKRLVIIDFLSIGIFYKITLRCSLLLIEYFKLYLTMNLRGSWLRQYPSWVEVLNMSNTWYNARL